MGKGRIVFSGPGEGQYTVDVLRDMTKLTAAIGRLTAKIAAINTKIAEAEANATAKKAAFDTAEAVLNEAIAGLSGSPPTTEEDVEKAQTEWLKALNAWREAEREAKRLRLQRIGFEKTRGMYASIPETIRHAGAWCVDYTTNLSPGRETGVIEVNGEEDAVLIRPGGAAFSPGMGQIQAVMGGSDSQAAWNWTMLPGWQKWKPTFRIGTVTAIDRTSNTCAVNLDDARSVALGLAINQASSLSGVPIVYMTCHAAVFQIGDRVVVEFQDQDWAKPRVIGFESHPRPCGFMLQLTRGDGTPVTPALSPQFWIRGASMRYWPAFTETYVGTPPGLWRLMLTEPPDPGGHWIIYECTEGIRTQYPTRYKTADLYKPADLRNYGLYEDTIHRIVGAYHPAVDGGYVPAPDGGDFVVADGRCYFKTSISRHYRVESSIPYKIRYVFNKAAAVPYYWTKLYWCTDPADRSVSFDDVEDFSVVSGDGAFNRHFTDADPSILYDVYSEEILPGINTHSLTVTQSCPETHGHVCRPPEDPFVDHPYEAAFLWFGCPEPEMQIFYDY